MANDAPVSNASYVRPDVTEMKPRWDMIRDCLAGQDAIKDAGVKYLPMPNPSDTSAENRERYRQYLERAVFYNVAKRTHAGLVGQVFQKTPVLEVPRQLDIVLSDADGGGVGMLSQSKKTLGNVLAFGRAGLLTDYPATSAPSTQQQVMDGSSRPTISTYGPGSIINWRTRMVGARKMLSMVVLQEDAADDSDEFELVYSLQWRVLRLGPDGIYTVQLYGVSEDEDSPVVPTSEVIIPRDASGAPLKEIPFTFVGAVNNDEEIDLPPLADLCDLNIAHYRNSADWEEASYICGQPTLVLAGLTDDWVKNQLGGTVRIGSRGAVPLPVGGSADLLQASPNTMPATGMERKEAQMVALGAKLLEQRQVQRTATDARIEYATEISVLGTSAANTAEAYLRALKWCGQFAGTDEPSKFEMAVDFDLGKMTAQEQQQLVESWVKGALSTSEMRGAMKRAGLATLDDEAYEAELAKRRRAQEGSRVDPAGKQEPAQAV